MINLLPQEDQNKVKRERLQRIFVLAGLFFAFVIAFAVIFLLPSFIFLTFENLSIKHGLEVVESKIEKEKASGAESLLADIKKKTAILESAKNQRRDLAKIFGDVILQKPANLKLNTLLYERASGESPERVSFEGQAASRESFLGFIKSLEGNPIFKKVASPISNLLHEKNLTFSLVIEFAK